LMTFAGFMTWVSIRCRDFQSFCDSFKMGHHLRGLGFRGWCLRGRRVRRSPWFDRSTADAAINQDATGGSGPWESWTVDVLKESMVAIWVWINTY
jgi:hypothetical protein